MKTSGVSSRGEFRTSGSSGLGEGTATDGVLVGRMGCFVEVMAAVTMLIDGKSRSQAVRKETERTTKDVFKKSRREKSFFIRLPFEKHLLTRPTASMGFILAIEEYDYGYLHTETGMPSDKGSHPISLHTKEPWRY
jgi:hypothetical protein